MSSEKEKKQGLHFSLLIFLVCLLFSFIAWNHYLNSPDPIDRNFASNLVLLSGFLFSCLAGIFTWTLECRASFLEREVEKRSRELARKEMEQRVTDAASMAICWLSQIIFTNQKDHSLFDSVINLVKKVLQADEVSLMLMDEQQELTIAASSGIPEEIVRKTRIKLGERIAGRAALRRREFLINGLPSQMPEFKDIKDNPSIRSSIVCPLICCDQIIGVLNLNRILNPEPFTEIHLRHAMIIASQIAQVIWNERINRSLNNKESELEGVYQKLKNMGVAL